MLFSLKGYHLMVTCRTGTSLVFALLALSWIAPASPAELEITKPLISGAALKQPAASYTATATKRVVSHPTRLALQEDRRCAGAMCTVLFLGVGY